jgi:hypothetical protein
MDARRQPPHKLCQSLSNRQSHWYKYVYDILAMLVPTRIEARISEIPVSGDYSLTGVKCDSRHESC